jgi:hypothetical protein
MPEIHREGCDGSSCRDHDCGVCQWCLFNTRFARKLTTVEDRSRQGVQWGCEARVCDLCRAVVSIRPTEAEAFQLRLANAVIDAVRDPGPR